MIISKNRIVTSLTKVVLSHTLLSPMANANLGATFSMIGYVWLLHSEAAAIYDIFRAQLQSALVEPLNIDEKRPDTTA